MRAIEHDEYSYSVFFVLTWLKKCRPI